MKTAKVVPSLVHPGYFHVMWHGIWWGGEFRHLSDAIRCAQGREHAEEWEQRGWIADHAEEVSA